MHSCRLRFQTLAGWQPGGVVLKTACLPLYQTVATSAACGSHLQSDVGASLDFSLLLKNPWRWVYTLIMFQVPTCVNRLETTNRHVQLKSSSNLETYGRRQARRCWERMVELSGCGSSNGKWEVIKEKRLFRLSIRWMVLNGAEGLPAALFILICLADESDRTKRTTLSSSDSLPAWFFNVLDALFYLLSIPAEPQSKWFVCFKFLYASTCLVSCFPFPDSTH